MERDPNASPEQSRPTTEAASASFLAGGWGSPADAARYIDCSLPFVYRLIRTGRLTAFRVGGGRMLRLRRSDCDAYVETRIIREAIRRSGVLNGR